MICEIPKKLFEMIDVRIRSFLQIKEEYTRTDTTEAGAEAPVIRECHMRHSSEKKEVYEWTCGWDSEQTKNIPSS